jgi:uncharacterized protein (TIGR03435 family)
MRTAIRATGCFFVGCGIIFAQGAGGGLSFEVASVKLAAPQPGGRGMTTVTGGPGSPDPERASYTNITLKNLLMTAYAVKQYQIAGPAWLDTEHYDIIAKVPPDSTKEQFSQMLQNLLAERFQLALHHESKEFQGYGLVVGKNRPKLKESAMDANAPSATPPTPGPPKLDQNGFPRLDRSGMIVMMTVEKGIPQSRMVAKDQSLAQLALMLGNQLGSPVLDQTGLAGKYDFKMAYDPRGSIIAASQSSPPGAAPAPLSDDPSEPDIFSALQEQLGLKLEARKVLLDVLVIDRADQAPTEN